MASIRTSSLVDAIQGKIGTTIFDLAKGGQGTVRRYSKRATRTPSKKQSEYRADGARIAAAWKTLTQVQKSLWDMYAKQLKQRLGAKSPVQCGGTRTLIKGKRGIMTGYNAFMGLNQTKFSAGFTVIVLNAPLGIALPPAPQLTSFFYHKLSKTFQVLWTIDAGSVPANSRARVWMRGSFRQHNFFIAQDTTATALIAQLTSFPYRLGTLAFTANFPGGFWSIQLDVITPLGLKSSPSNVLTDVID